MSTPALTEVAAEQLVEELMHVGCTLTDSIHSSRTVEGVGHCVLTEPAQPVLVAPGQWSPEAARAHTSCAPQALIVDSGSPPFTHSLAHRGCMSTTLAGCH